MNKLPKEIYVDETSDEPIFFTNAEECARPGETLTLGVYKLVGRVEVSTKQQAVVKKVPAAKKNKLIAVEMPQDRDALLDEMQVARRPYQPTNVNPETPRTFA